MIALHCTVPPSSGRDRASGADHRPDGRLLLTAPFHRYGEDRDAGHLESVDLAHEYVAPLRDAIAAAIWT